MVLSPPWRLPRRCLADGVRRPPRRRRGVLHAYDELRVPRAILADSPPTRARADPLDGQSHILHNPATSLEGDLDDIVKPSYPRALARPPRPRHRIPHPSTAASTALNRTLASRRGGAFGSIDGEPVHVFFLLISPQTGSATTFAPGKTSSAPPPPRLAVRDQSAIAPTRRAILAACLDEAHTVWAREPNGFPTTNGLWWTPS